MTDLITRARALSRYEHDDASIGDECADEIERLTADYAAATHLLADRDAQIERLTAELATLRASAASVQADQRAEIDAANAVIDELLACKDRLPGEVAVLPNNEPYDPSSHGNWRLHRCADGEQCRTSTPGGCADGWCAHFDVNPEHDGLPRFSHSRDYDSREPLAWNTARALRKGTT